MCTSLSVDRNICSNQLSLTFVKNAIQACKCHKCPCKFSFLVNVFYLTQVVYCMEMFFFQAFRSMANKTYKWQVTKSVYVGMTIFLPNRKKRTRDHPFAHVDVHNAMARTVLETNSSGDVLLGKEKLHCYNESFGSKNLI